MVRSRLDLRQRAPITSQIRSARVPWIIRSAISEANTILVTLLTHILHLLIWMEVARVRIPIIGHRIVIRKMVFVVANKSCWQVARQRKLIQIWNQFLNAVKHLPPQPQLTVNQNYQINQPIHNRTLRKTLRILKGCQISPRPNKHSSSPSLRELARLPSPPNLSNQPSQLYNQPRLTWPKPSCSSNSNRLRCNPPSTHLRWLNPQLLHPIAPPHWPHKLGDWPKKLPKPSRSSPLTFPSSDSKPRPRRILSWPRPQCRIRRSKSNSLMLSRPRWTVTSSNSLLESALPGH